MFCIQLDHKPLKFLFNEYHQIPVMASARIQRWVLILGTYNYRKCYKPGSLLSNADTLSRLLLPANSSNCSKISEELHILLTNILKLLSLLTRLNCGRVKIQSYHELNN